MEEILELKNQGLRTKEICEQLHVSKSFVYKTFKNNNVVVNKTNAYDYNEIQKMINDGLSVDDISNKIGISKKYLYEQLKRKGIEINRVNRKKYVEPKKKRCDIYNFSFSPMSDTKAYYLGLIYGDGSIGKPNKKDINLGMCDFDILDKLNRELFNNNIHICERKLKSGKIQYRLNVYNSIIWKELIDNYSLTNNKSRIIKFPNLEHQFISHFMRGIVDSDGSFFINNKKLNFSFGCASYDFIERFRNVLYEMAGTKNVKISQFKYKQFYICKWFNFDAIKIGKFIYEESTENNRGERKFNIWNNNKGEI